MFCLLTPTNCKTVVGFILFEFVNNSHAGLNTVRNTHIEEPKIEKKYGKFTAGNPLALKKGSAAYLNQLHSKSILCASNNIMTIYSTLPS